jgi:hypothetical protein
MKRKLLLLAAMLPGIAAAEGIGLTGKIGTLGLGGELTANLSESWNARVGLNNYSWSTTRTESDVEYDAKLKLQTLSAIADYHPFQGGFRMSVGLFYNKNRLDMVGKPTAGSTYELDGTTYTAAQVGSLTGKLDFNKTAPYLGIGWGNAVAKDTSWNFSFDLGVMLQGKPKFKLSSDSALCGSGTACNDSLVREQAQAESDLNSFKWYPVISFGASYQF